jgi:peptide/nickel transport system permease protein
MLRYVGLRLLALLPTVLVPVLFVFLLIRLAPGDPAAQMLGDDATPQALAELRRQLGLDAPLGVQFGLFVRQLFTLQLGDSLFLHQPVVQVIPGYAAVTLQLSAIALVVALAVGLGLGSLAGFRRRRPLGRLATGAGILGISVPGFLVALVLILVFAVGLRWFPVGGYVPPDAGLWPHLRSLLLPGIALGLAEAGFVSRVIRGALVDVIPEPFVTTARAMGVRGARIARVHIMRMASLQLLTVVGLLAASLISGSVVIENIFGLPGVGQLLFSAVSNRDYALVQGIVLFSGIAVIVVNLVVDVLYAVLDPRVRYGARAA